MCVFFVQGARCGKISPWHRAAEAAKKAARKAGKSAERPGEWR